MRKLPKKRLELDSRTTNAFNKLTEHIRSVPCLAHYHANIENMVTTDASTKRLEATLWNRNKDGNLKPVGHASRFLSEKKYAISEHVVLAAVWGLEFIRLQIYGRPIELLTDHQALEPLMKCNKSNKTNSARQTRWLDGLAHFDMKIDDKTSFTQTLGNYRFPQHNLGVRTRANRKLRRRVRNCIIPLETTNNHGSINESKMEERTTQRSVERKPVYHEIAIETI